MRWAPLLLLLACAARPAAHVPGNVPIAGVRYQNAHLIGAEGRSLLGGFVTPGAWPIGPHDVQRTACSEHFEVVDAEARPLGQAVFGAAPEIARKLHLNDGDAPGVAWADVQPGTRQIAAIRDPTALARCCTADPGACTDRYVAEILTGSGRLYRPEGEPAQWFPASKVRGAFGFRLGGNPYVGPDCGTWQHGAPAAVKGRFFLGVSTTTFNEETARRDALSKARREARDWLRAEGRGDSELGQLREERWCVERFGEGGERRHLAHVLLYLP